MQRSALCRSRRELSNAYLLAKFGFDTAENEPSKVCRPPPRAATTRRRRGGRPPIVRDDPGRLARSGKFDRARSRLYRRQILQENMRLKALAEIYTMHSFAQLCNLTFFCQNFAKILQNSAKFLKIFAIFSKNLGIF